MTNENDTSGVSVYSVLGEGVGGVVGGAYHSGLDEDIIELK